MVEIEKWQFTASSMDTGSWKMSTRIFTIPNCGWQTNCNLPWKGKLCDILQLLSNNYNYTWKRWTRATSTTAVSLESLDSPFPCFETTWDSADLLPRHHNSLCVFKSPWYIECCTWIKAKIILPSLLTLTPILTSSLLVFWQISAKLALLQIHEKINSLEIKLPKCVATGFSVHWLCWLGWW